MTLGEVWPSFPDEGGAVQLSTLGGQEEEWIVRIGHVIFYKNIGTYADPK